MASKHIIVTGTDKDATAFALRLQSAGYDAKAFATIRITKKKLNESSLDALRNIESYDYLLFTSAHAVRFFVDELRDQWIKKPSTITIVAVGPATARALAEAGFTAQVVGRRPGFEGLSLQLKEVSGKRVLFPRSTKASDDAIKALENRGALVTPLLLYATVPLSAPQAVFQEILADADYVIFMSPSAIEGFVSNVAKVPDSTILTEQVRSIRALCIGPFTGRAACKAGFKQIVIAKPSTTDGILNTLQKLF